MRIAITAQEGTKDFHFAGAPWDVFKVTLESYGHQVVSIDSNPDFLIMNNFSRKLQRNSGLTSKESQVLVVWEPPSNKPQNFNEKNLSNFGRVYFPSPIWVQNFGGNLFSWPQGSAGPRHEISWSDRIDQFCFIQANRWSVYPGERYSFRRKTLRSLNNNIAIFGHHWNRGLMVDAIYAFYTLIKRSRSTRINCSGLRGIGYTYINYYGPTENKIETMGHYKYSLVIENSHEYVSEKLIDAILAKTVPLYIGANLEKLNIPPNIAYTCEAQIDSVAEAMERLLSDSKLCKAILDNGQAFLKSRHFKKMKNNIALRNLAIDISEYIESV